MNWLEYLLKDFGPVALLVAAAVYLVKKLLERDEAKFQAMLATRFTRLHEKRLECLAELYQKLENTQSQIVPLALQTQYDLHMLTTTELMAIRDGSSLQDFDLPLSLTQDEFSEAALQIAAQADRSLGELTSLFNGNKLYLDKQLTGELYTVMHRFRHYLGLVLVETD